MIIRLAVAADAVALARLRAVMLSANGKELLQLDAQLLLWEQWFTQGLTKGEYLGFVAEVEGQAVGTVGVMFYPCIPSAVTDLRHKPHILNVAVEQQWRGQGIARQLMQSALADLQARGYATVTLNAAPMGRKLYEQLGFVENANPAMTLHFTSLDPNSV